MWEKEVDKTTVNGLEAVLKLPPQGSSFVQQVVIRSLNIHLCVTLHRWLIAVTLLTLQIFEESEIGCRIVKSNTRWEEEMAKKTRPMQLLLSICNVKYISSTDCVSFLSMALLTVSSHSCFSGQSVVQERNLKMTSMMWGRRLLKSLTD